MSTATTIEEYVEEIDSLLHDSDFDGLTDICDTLDKMRFNSKEKYRLTYWRVMQCLGELTVDKQVKYIESIYKTSCKCHLYQYVRCFMRLFVEMMCNVAVIKRIIYNKEKVMPLLFKAIRQTDEELLAVLALEATYKCLVVGKTELTELYVKFGLLKDLYHCIKVKNDSSIYNRGSIIFVLCCSKIIHAISVCGTESIQRQLRRSPVVRALGDFTGKLISNSVNKQGVQALVDSFANIKRILGDGKEAMLALQEWNPKNMLQQELGQDQLYIFCSFPGCRKLYAESVKFRYCGACRLARYCSETCQKEHWKKTHKETCLGAASSFK